MKQYLNSNQTAKLIELGFEKPSNTIVKEEPIYREGSIIDWKPIAEEGAYSIGELIEMLPMIIGKNYGYTLSIYMDGARWIVAYDNGDEYSTLYAITKDELIDSLYDMIIKLKEEGVI